MFVLGDGKYLLFCEAAHGDMVAWERNPLYRTVLTYYR
jgi:ribosomal protein L24E